MATRLYLQSTGAAPFDPAFADGAWERNSGAYVARNMATAKQDTALTTLSAVFGATATSQTRYATFVSDTLDVAQTIAGNFSLVIGKCAETTTAGDAHLAYKLRVVTGEGVHRATLRTLMGTSTEFALIASAATRIIAAGAVTSFNADAGDRLVLEIGIHGVTPANQVMQMRIGDPVAVADFALTAALTTDLVSWGELSQNVTFGTPPAPVEALPGTGLLDAIGFAALVLLPLNLTPSVGEMAVTGVAPTVEIGAPAAPVNVLPDVGVLTFDGFVATVTTPRVVLPDVGTLDLLGVAPTVQTPRALLPDAGAATLTGFEPTAVGGSGAAVNVLPDVGALDLTGFSASVQTPRNTAPDVGVIDLAGVAPTVAGGSGAGTEVLPDVGAVVLAGLAPVVEIAPPAPEIGSGGGGGSFSFRAPKRKRERDETEAETFQRLGIYSPARRTQWRTERAAEKAAYHEGLLMAAAYFLEDE